MFISFLNLYIVTFVTEFPVEGYSFDCIRPMLNFLNLKYLSHRNMLKSKASWKGLDKSFCCPVTCTQMYNILL